MFSSSMYFVQAARVPLAKVVLASEHKISSDIFHGGENTSGAARIYPRQAPLKSKRVGPAKTD